MKNTHLEHPEDAILTGGKQAALELLNFFQSQNSKFTVKWDGAPAIVFGTCPETGKFFVGTKSVFNKKKIKINYNHLDISKNHEGRVESILHTAFECLPRITGVVQGDFIGFGGSDRYQPNTIEYIFDSVIEESLIFAAHTSYFGESLKTVTAQFSVPELNFDSCKFLNINASLKKRSRKIALLCLAAKFLIPFVKFPSEDIGSKLKIEINKYIRNGVEPNIDELSNCYADKNLFRLYFLIIAIKNLFLRNMQSEENVQCHIAEKPSNHEGYVMSNEYGTYKLVDRLEFSVANFTIAKNWSK
jgi:Family of unknown function (DUF6267)